MVRTSKRSASRDVPSPPLKHASPISKNTRSTRSQSRDLDARRTRQESIDLDARPPRQESVESTESNKERRSRRVTRKTAAVVRDLSIVAEDREPLSEEEDEDQDEDQDEDDDEEDPDATKVAEPSKINLQADEHESTEPHFPASPAMSGTTVNTKHTERVLQTIDSTTAVESLSDLYDAARRIINKSANRKVRPKDMEHHSRVLNSLSKAFEVMKEPYGTEQFIEVDIVLRKIFRSKTPGDGDIPLSAILHLANLATLTSKVNEQRQADRNLDEPGQQRLKVFLQSLEKMFPSPFVSKFAVPSNLENSEGSRLIQESFKMVLDIRTQLFIAVSRELETKPGFDPDLILRMLFLDDTDYQGFFGSLDNPEDRAGERLDQIHTTFKPTEQATGPGKYVDFNRLDDMYPKSEFYNNLVSYGEKRLIEIENVVEARGGIENVIESLQDLVGELGSDAEPEISLDYNNSPRSVAEDKDNPSSKTMVPKQPPYKDPHKLRQFAKLKSNLGSQQSGDRGNSNRPDSSTNTRSSSPGPSPSRAVSQQQASKLTEAFKAFDTSQNKENQRPDQRRRSRSYLSTTNTARRGMYKDHPNAERVEWNEDSQGFPEPPQTKNNKRKASPSPEAQVRDEDLSSDQGFETDQRNLRTRRTPEPGPPARPRKRARTEAGESSRVQSSRGENRSREASLPNIEQRRDQLRRDQSVVVGGDENSLELSDDDTPNDSDVPFSQTQGIARMNARAQALRVGANRSQTRNLWSDADTKRLVRFIGRYGANWAEIERARHHEFDRDNITQVSLKDKARNIKAAMLQAGEMLPKNFDQVKLNAALIARVRTTYPEYNPNGDTGYGGIDHQINYT